MTKQPEPRVPLLDEDEPAAVLVETPDGPSRFLLVCDHYGNRLPRRLGDLGLSRADLRRHIAWDIGIAGVSHDLARRLGATLIAQVYSRLAIDCNRRPGHPTSIAAASEGLAIPGNIGLDDAARAARRRALFEPYHAAITAALDARAARVTIVVAMHSFTPVFHGVARPWHAGVLHNRDPRLALALAALLRGAGHCVGDNEPYSLSDESDYTIPCHAESRGLPYLELEIRQDLIESPAGQARWAELLGEMLPLAADDARLRPGG